MWKLVSNWCQTNVTRLRWHWKWIAAARPTMPLVLRRVFAKKKTKDQMSSKVLDWRSKFECFLFSGPSLFSKTKLFKHHPCQVAGPCRPGNRKEAILSRGHSATPFGATVLWWLWKWLASGKNWHVVAKTCIMLLPTCFYLGLLLLSTANIGLFINKHAGERE